MTLALAVLISALTWDAVTHDCRSGLESAPPVYLVPLYQVTVIGWAPDVNGDPAPLYSRTQAEQMTPATSMPLPDPPVGGLIAWGDPVAVDLSGNRSDEPCTP